MGRELGKTNNGRLIHEITFETETDPHLLELLCVHSGVGGHRVVVRQRDLINVAYIYIRIKLFSMLHFEDYVCREIVHISP